MNEARSARRSGDSRRSRPTRRQFVEWIAVLMVAAGCAPDASTSESTPTSPPTTRPPPTTNPPTTQPPAPPTITISTPDGARFCQEYLEETDPLACELVASAAVEIRGSVTPGAQVSVQNQEAEVDGSTWTARVPVGEGPTTINVKATNAGGSATATVRIEYVEFERSDW